MADSHSSSSRPLSSRLIGQLPKVGIRPAIDGRRKGVRESLEKQTMTMARTVADFITRNVRHSNGSPVECIIADNCIGGTAEAAQTAEQFDRQGVGVTLTVSPCWCYGAETMDMDPFQPKAVWGFNGTERPGAVYLASVIAAHAQKGLPAFSIYGMDVQDSDDTIIPEDVQEKILRFVRSGIAVATMRGKTYLSMGGTSMGIAGSMIQPSFMEKYLGLRTEAIDMSEFTRRIEERIYDQKEFEKALGWVKTNCREGKDYNKASLQKTRAAKDQDWEFCVKMAMIARDLMIGNARLQEMGYGEEALGRNAIASGFQGQRQWTDHFPNGDFMEAILNSSFDWNGIRQPFILATENDALNGISMLFGHLLTGTAQIFADVRTYWSPAAVKRVTGWEPEGPAAGGFLHLINSGAAALDAAGKQSLGNSPAIKPYWEIDPKEVEACLAATTWCPASLEYFRGGGFSSHFLSPGGMPLTMCRINLIDGLGPVLQLAEGYSVELPEKVNEALELRTDPGWPTTWFTPRITGKYPFTDAYSVMANWGANHGALCYGHIGLDMISLASLLRIPVYMHNLPQEKLFRPAVWSAFGTSDPEGADYRACANFGPLYGR